MVDESHDINMADDDESLAHSSSSTHFVVYRRRWYMLASVCILNISNAMTWISFSPIADQTATYYDTSLMAVNWLSLVYLVASIPFGLVSQFLLDTLGLRAGLTLGATLNFLGSILRLMSTFDFVTKEYKFTVTMMGQSLAACAQPFLLFAPTKLAAQWFKDSQRATANMVASMSNPLGILVANVLSPLIVNKAVSTDFLNMQISYLVPAGVAFGMALGITRSVPWTPPSSSAQDPSEPFISGMKKIIKLKNYWVLAISFGIGLGLFTAFSTLLEQILCPWGYDDDFAGLCGALMIVGGVIGAALAGLYVDKTKKFEEVAKICMCFAALSGIAFTFVLKVKDAGPAIITTLTLFGTFGFAIFPVCMELAIESTYPVAEATAAGFLIIFGQVFGIAFILAMQVTAIDISSDQSVCKKTPQDYWISDLIGIGSAALGACFLTSLYKCEYKRLKSERNVEAEKILNFSQSRESFPESFITT